MSDLFRLDGHCALVTGASGSLGRHFANVLARAGAAIALAARRLDELEIPESRHSAKKIVKILNAWARVPERIRETIDDE